VYKYDLIALEDIDSKELSEQGNGFGKYIRSQAWSRFAEFVNYKASKAGVHVIQVDPTYTSQDCSNPSCSGREKKSLFEQDIHALNAACRWIGTLTRCGMYCLRVLTR